MSRMPWIMTQEWHESLFLHWPISPETLRKHIPAELELDLFDGMAWISLILFKVKGNRPRFIPPVPGTSSFLELNVRTYVSYKGRNGVYFFSLDADHPLIVKLTTLGNFLPYRNAKIKLKRHKNTITFKSKRIHKNTFPETLITTFELDSRILKKGPLEIWLTERYHLWTKIKGDLFRVDIRHSPWVLQDVTGTIHENTMASFIKNTFQKERPIAHYSKMKKAWLFPPVKERE